MNGVETSDNDASPAALDGKTQGRVGGTSDKASTHPSGTTPGGKKKKHKKKKYRNLHDFMKAIRTSIHEARAAAWLKEHSDR